MGSGGCPDGEEGVEQRGPALVPRLEPGLRFDLVVGSDVVYHPHLIDPLAATVARRLAR